MLNTSVRLAFIFMQTILYLVSRCEIIWRDPLNDTNGAYLEWQISGTVDPHTGSELLCPSTMNGCWRFTETSSAHYTFPTVHYQNTSVTFSVFGDDDLCTIYYSIDESTDWILFSTSWTTSSVQSLTIDLPSDASNNLGVAIKITSLQNYCYFSDIIFEGDRITKATPNNVFEYILSLSLMVIIISASIAVLCVVFLCIICFKLCRKKAVSDTKKQMQHTLNVNSASDATKTDKMVYGSDIVEVNEIHTNGAKHNMDSNPITPADNDREEIEAKPESQPLETIIVADDNKEASEESDDSLMRKQRQYEFEEECNIEEDGDINTPLPDFETNLNLGVTTESVVLEHIMHDMKNSQLKLQYRKETLDADHD